MREREPKPPRLRVSCGRETPSQEAKYCCVECRRKRMAKNTHRLNDPECERQRASALRAPVTVKCSRCSFSAEVTGGELRRRSQSTAITAPLSLSRRNLRD